VRKGKKRTFYLTVKVKKRTDLKYIVRRFTLEGKQGKEGARSHQEGEERMYAGLAEERTRN